MVTSPLTLCRWRLAPGAFTFVLGLNALAMGFLDQPYSLAWLVIYLLAGVLLDGLYRGLSPEPLRPLAVRWFAVLASAGLMAVYFALGRLVLPFNRSVHMIGGVVGFFFGLLMFSPGTPSGSGER